MYILPSLKTFFTVISELEECLFYFNLLTESKTFYHREKEHRIS